MTRDLEQQLNEIQLDMIALCYEYAQKKVDEIFIYISLGEFLYTDFFFKRDERVTKKHEIQEASVDLQKKALAILLDDAKKIASIFSSNKQDIPSQVKIEFDVAKKELEVDYDYSNLNSEKIYDKDLFNSWVDSQS